MVTPATLCNAVDAIFPHVDGTATHALMYVNTCAYRVLEGGGEDDVVTLRDAIATLVATPSSATAHALALRVAEMAEALSKE